MVLIDMVFIGLSFIILSLDLILVFLVDFVKVLLAGLE